MNQQVLICSELDSSGVCASEQWVNAYLIPPDSGTAVELFLTGGFSAEAAGVGFGGTIALFIAGLGIGFIIKFIRRI